MMNFRPLNGLTNHARVLIMPVLTFVVEIYLKLTVTPHKNTKSLPSLAGLLLNLRLHRLITLYFSGGIYLIKNTCPVIKRLIRVLPFKVAFK